MTTVLQTLRPVWPPARTGAVEAAGRAFALRRMLPILRATGAEPHPPGPPWRASALAIADGVFAAVAAGAAATGSWLQRAAEPRAEAARLTFRRRALLDAPERNPVLLPPPFDPLVAVAAAAAAACQRPDALRRGASFRAAGGEFRERSW